MCSILYIAQINKMFATLTNLIVHIVHIQLILCAYYISICLYDFYGNSPTHKSIIDEFPQKKNVLKTLLS